MTTHQNHKQRRQKRNDDKDDAKRACDGVVLFAGAALSRARPALAAAAALGARAAGLVMTPVM